MRYFAIELSYNEYIVLPLTPESGQLLAALGQGYRANKTREGRSDVYSRMEGEMLGVKFIDESELSAPPEPIIALSKETENANKRWLEEYNKRVQVEKERDAISAQLKAVQEAAKKGASDA